MLIFDILSVTFFIVTASSICHSAECSYAERSSSEYHFAEGSSSEYHYADRHCNAEWHFFCCYAECHYVECRNVLHCYADWHTFIVMLCIIILIIIMLSIVMPSDRILMLC
jgi:hypothetical protein